MSGAVEADINQTILCAEEESRVPTWTYTEENLFHKTRLFAAIGIDEN